MRMIYRDRYLRPSLAAGAREGRHDASKQVLLSSGSSLRVKDWKSSLARLPQWFPTEFGIMMDDRAGRSLASQNRWRPVGLEIVALHCTSKCPREPRAGPRLSSPGTRRSGGAMPHGSVLWSRGETQAGLLSREYQDLLVSFRLKAAGSVGGKLAEISVLAVA